MKTNNFRTQWMTLVELIVVITILAILWTIAFVSFQGFWRYARDSTRISDMTSIIRSLEFHQTRYWYYPDPDWSVDIMHQSSLLFTQGHLWEDASWKIRVHPIPLDPLTNLPYWYSLSNTKREFQLAWVFEWFFSYDNTLQHWIINESYANLSWFTRLRWNYNNMFLYTQESWIDTVIASPSLFISSTHSLDIEEIYQTNNIVAQNSINKPFHFNSWEEINWWVSFGLDNFIVFQWDINDLIQEEERLNFARNLYEIYINSNVDLSAYSSISNLSPFTHPTEAQKFVENIVNANVAWIRIKDFLSQIVRSSIDWYNIFRTGDDDSINSNQIRSITADNQWWIWFWTNSAWVSYFNDDNWISYTNANTSWGLRNNRVYNIYVDTNNNIWFATNSWISVFDGSQWATYTTSSGLPNNRIYDIVQDSVWNMWAATHWGVAVLNGNSWTNFNTSLSLNSNSFRKIITHSSGDIWTVAYDGWVWVYDWENWTTFTSQDTQNINTDNIHTLIEWENGDVWIWTHGRWAVRYSIANSQWTEFRWSQYFNNDRVRNIYNDNEWNLWFGTENGISMYSWESWVKHTTILWSNNIRGITQDSAWNMWFWTADNGVTRFDWESWSAYLRSENLLSNNLRIVTWDNQQNIWIATSDNWVNKYDGDTTWENIDSSISGINSNIVRDILADSLWTTWLATSSWLSMRLSWQNNWSRRTTSHWLWNNSLYALFQDSDWYVWVGTNGWVSRQQSIWANTFTNYTTSDGLVHNRVYAITQDSEWNMWFATWGWLSKYDGDTWENFTSSNTSNIIASNDIRSITYHTSWSIIIGTTSWLTIYDTIDDTWERFTTSDGLLHNSIRDITIDNNGTIWIATSSGLNSLDISSHTFSSYTTQQWIIGNSVYNIYIDWNSIWLASNSGLSRWIFR